MSLSRVTSRMTEAAGMACVGTPVYLWGVEGNGGLVRVHTDVTPTDPPFT